MKNWLKNLGNKMQQGMQGRYGNDELSRFLSIVGIIALLISFVPAIGFLYIPALILLIWSCIRCYSKNIERRRKERDTYLRLTGRTRSEVSLCKRRWSDRKTHHYYKCEQCRTVLRAPKGKGKIKITCPKCRREAIKKT